MPRIFNVINQIIINNTTKIKKEPTLKTLLIQALI